jgi:diguanylate cyclase (GGDEF)-like protein
MMAHVRSDVLRWLVTAVVVAGAVATVGAFFVFGEPETQPVPVRLLAALLVLVAVGSFASVRVRLQSAVVAVAWTDAAILVCIVSLPPAWVPLTVALGVLVAKLFSRITPFKAAYNAAKDALSAFVGVAVAIPLGVANSTEPLAHLWHVLVLSLVVGAAEHLIGVPVLSLASTARWQQVLCLNGDIKILMFLGQTAVALLTLWLYAIDPRLLAVVPPVALCLHLMYAARVSARSELAAWQRLAATTEELNDTNLDAVLAAAVVNAAKLFSAEQAEVFLRDGPDGPVLVRGDAEDVRWSGDPGQAPALPHAGESVAERLAGPAGADTDGDLGEVRLHYAGPVRLSDRERLTLATFASALRTAVRNATAFAQARQLAARNAHAALHDPLTGVANRRHLLEYGAGVLNGVDGRSASSRADGDGRSASSRADGDGRSASSRADGDGRSASSRADVDGRSASSRAEDRTIALVVLDVDLFREVNEALGHLAGDRVLAEVARRLDRAVGPADLVARLSGDEFAVLLVGLVSVEAAQLRASDLLATLDAPIDLDGMRVRVEASAGVAAVPASGEGDADEVVVELLRRADIAMYQAKRGGPRIVGYDVSRDTADLAQLMLGGDLPRAIAQREFAVSFQPIVDLATGDMISAEALARWHHPEHGDLNPRRFLAAVERSGLLPAFAEAVLDQALETTRRWRAAGIGATVAVNASPRSLLDPAFPRMVARLLAKHGLVGADLVIELTESLTLSQVDLVGGVLRELKATGIRLALDDFGTGYSSLAMLAKVPAYELKVDRSFVAAMTGSPEAMAVVRSTVELGRSLSRLVVAEGVERPEQRQVLWEMGCRAGQGHLFGAAMPADQLLAVATAGVGGVLGRICAPIHAAGNVIELPRARRPEADESVAGAAGDA